MKRCAWLVLLAGVGAGCADTGGAPFRLTDVKTTKTTDSGLKIEDVTVGTGAEVHVGDVVVVHYTGWLTDGKKFDSSLGRGQPMIVAGVGAAKVIKGWDEGLVGMKEGGKRRLEIPPELGYGKGGIGKEIPADATLLFEIDLLEIKPWIKIEDLKEGTGPGAKPGDTVLVYYTGKLKDGKVFDSNVGGEPFAVRLGEGKVIPGWDAGLVGMKAGGKRRLTIAPQMAYGERGAGDRVPPGATLTFEIELLKVGTPYEIFSTPGKAPTPPKSAPGKTPAPTKGK
jgi:peptidylprolyl isomerase